MNKTITEIAGEMFLAWNKALQTEDPKKVAELYTDDATFLPTMSGDFKKGVKGAKDYFEHFLTKKPFGKIIEEEIQGGENYIIHSGFYDFEVDDSNEERINVEARFTFVYTKQENGEYKICHHQSSLKPSL